MGQPVVHFEVVAKDPDKLRSFFSELFAWQYGEPMGPTDYTMVEQNTTEEGTGIAGGVGAAPEGYEGHVTFYVQVPDVGAALEKAERLGGGRMMGPDEVPGAGIVIGLMTDPEGRVIGLVSPAS